MKTIKYFILFILFYGAVSCENYLDPEPDGRKTENEVFTNYSYTLGYFADMYNQLPEGFHSIEGAMEATATDEAEHTMPGVTVQKYNDGSWNRQSFPDQAMYSKYYAALRKLNIFMENVDDAVFIEPNTFNRNPEINKTYQERAKAETHFLRAFYYFELVKRFGGVPIVPESRLTLDDNLDMPRNSYEECVDYIVKECNEAASKLPDFYTDATLLGHATKAAALALKSRMLLYAASPYFNQSNDIQKWQAALDACKEVLEVPGYRLLSYDEIKDNEMFTIWSESYNEEILLARQYFSNNDLEYNNFPVGFQGGQGLTNPTQNLVNAFNMANGLPISDPNSGYSSQDPYSNRDPRLSYFIGYNGQVYNSREIETYVGGLDGLNRDQYATKTGYYLRKFLNLDADLRENTRQARHHWVYFRYAEVLLNYAEAINEVYGPYSTGSGYPMTAKQAIDLIRERVQMPGLPNDLSQEEMRARIRNERQVELCFEGHRFWDVRRWMQGELFNQPIYGMRITRQANGEEASFSYEEFAVENRYFDTSKMYLMPIPYSEMLKSPALVQNPNWN